MGRKVTTEIFKLEAGLKHGDRYDYSRSIYKSAKQKIEIVCSRHGLFYQTAYDHLHSLGCQKCSYIERGSTRRSQYTSFIEDAVLVHGDTYDYSDTSYYGKLTKVKIRCKIHGDFKQLPHCHLGGQGCPLCKGSNVSKTKTRSDEWFINKAKEVHGDLYDYSNAKYLKSNEKLIVICKYHGEFKITPHKHLKGVGCFECAGKKEFKTRQQRSENFLNKAKGKFGDTLDYSLVDYINNSTLVKIRCNTCETIFEQTPATHLTGKGCKFCSKKIAHEKQKMTKEQFVAKAIEIHGYGTYNYDKSDYVRSSEGLNILCNRCSNEFNQRPYSHLKGSGCPHCFAKRGYSKSDYRRVCKKHDYISNIYLVRLFNDNEDFVKVGITVKDSTKKRFAARIPYDFEDIIFESSYCDDIYDLENLVKWKFLLSKYTPLKAFKGETECFEIAQKENIVKFINQELNKCKKI